MTVSAIQHHELHTALTDMTGAADIVEATFTPWDEDQARALDALLRDMHGLERLDAALSTEAA